MTDERYVIERVLRSVLFDLQQLLPWWAPKRLIARRIDAVARSYGVIPPSQAHYVLLPRKGLGGVIECPGCGFSTADQYEMSAHLAETGHFPGKP